MSQRTASKNKCERLRRTGDAEILNVFLKNKNHGNNKERLKR